MTTKAEAKRIYAEESAIILKSIIDRAPKGLGDRTEVFCVLKSVARSSRSITLYVLCARSKGRAYLHWLPSHRVAVVLGCKEDVKNGAVRIKNCGMDMGFRLVESLADKLNIEKPLIQCWL